jgi:ABC-2 type transport system ATP-binding protein
LTKITRRPYDEISGFIMPGAHFARPGFAQNGNHTTHFRPGHINMIKVEGLTKRYARTVAVNNISFEVEKGQIVGFLGPNGAGKTTTMRILTCFLPPTEGKASVAGFDVQEHPMEVKRRIGYLPETPPLYPEMDVSGYLDFAGQLKGISSGDIKKKVDDVVGRCALGDVRYKLIGKLSKGYRQRVGIAQAIIHNPPVLILDEPTSGLDPKQIIEIRDLLHELAGEHTIILSTHILSEVEHSCERVIIISGGKVVATDSVANLTNRLRGSEAVAVEIEAAGLHPNVDEAQQRLEQVQGVSRVVAKEPKDGRLRFEIESLQGRQIRADLARTVVNAGWNLSELSAVGLSLEEVFLQLTASEQKAQPEKTPEPVPEGSEK